MRMRDNLYNELKVSNLYTHGKAHSPRVKWAPPNDCIISATFSRSEPFSDRAQTERRHHHTPVLSERLISQVARPLRLCSYGGVYIAFRGKVRTIESDLFDQVNHITRGRSSSLSSFLSLKPLTSSRRQHHIMGRNAKFYKSHKSKKKESSTQKQVTDSFAKESTAKSNPKRDTRKESGIKDASAAARVDEQGMKSKEGMSAFETGTQGNKLKSKLWRDLEAKRAKEGKSEYSTPKEAGIDYLRQWEKRGR
jgi:hypothetical protein